MSRSAHYKNDLHCHEPIKVAKDYIGDVQQTIDGQWSWVLYRDGREHSRGAIYPSEDEAAQAMFKHLKASGCEFE